MVYQVIYFACSHCDDKYEHRIDAEDHEGECSRRPQGDVEGVYDELTQDAEDFENGRKDRVKSAMRRINQSTSSPRLRSKTRMTPFLVVASSTRPSPGRLTCSSCGQQFNKRATLNRHMKTHNEQGITIDVKQEMFDIDEGGEENEEMDQKPMLSTIPRFDPHHETTTVGYAGEGQPIHRRYRCKTCGMAFVTQGLLRSHVLRGKHRPQEPSALINSVTLKQIKCALCDKYFSTATAKMKHDAIEHPPKRVKCRFCGDKFLNEDTMMTHCRRLHVRLAKLLGKQAEITGVDWEAIAPES